MNENKKIAFIINPISGTKKKTDIPLYIHEKLDGKFEIDIRFTERKGHAFEMAQQMASEGYDIIVAVGGDGTVNEIASALVHTNTALGIIPCGSGNGLARHLQIPLDCKEAIELFHHYKIVDIDYGTANDIKFFCTCGVGFDAHIGYVFSQNKKRGFWTYLKSVVGEFVSYKPKKYKFKTRQVEFKKKAFLVTFANASQYGNDAFIAPHADIQDGLIDVCILEPFPAFQAVDIGYKLMSKKLDRCRYVQILKTDKVKIKRKKKDVFHYDGEPCVMKKKIKIESHPRGLKVAVNVNAPFN
jgi:YegS/Rv2252/BmrU family lipid kinase